MLKLGLPAILLTLAVSLFLLAASVYLLGTNDGLMLDLMQRYAPPETTGLPDSEYPGAVRMITAYLRGDAQEFQHVYTLNGSQVLAFNQKEQQHMADVRGLFLLVKDVMQIGLAIAGLMLVFLALPDMIWRTGLLNALACAVTGLAPQALFRALRTGLLVVLGVVGALAVWAALDFTSLFIFFHRIAFTNELWMLDPRTDLLIRLMPTNFFVTYAALIGAVWFTVMGLAVLFTCLLTKERKV